MEKAIRFYNKKIVHFCDICKKEQKDYGDYAAYELLSECDLCGKQVCEDCRGEVPTVNCNVPETTLCVDCWGKNISIIEKISENITNFNTIDIKLRGLLKHSQG